MTRHTKGIEAETKKWKAGLPRSMARDLRERHKATNRELAGKLKQLREELRRIGKEVRTAIGANKERVRAWRKRAIERVRAAAKRAIERAVAKCREKGEERARPIRQGLAEAAAERARIAEAKPLKASSNKPGGRPAVSAKVRISESDDAVRVNLEERLLPLWEKVKRSIKGGDHWSRTEQFLHFVEENPEQVLAAMEAEIEREMATLQQQQAASGGAPPPPAKKRPRKGPKRPHAPKKAAQVVPQRAKPKRARKRAEPNERPVEEWEGPVTSDFDVDLL